MNLKQIKEQKCLEMKVLEMEDFLSERDVFLNGISGEPASLGSYMTVFDYLVLFNLWDELVETFGKEVIKHAVKYYKHQSYLGPSFKLMHSFLQRKVEAWS